MCNKPKETEEMPKWDYIEPLEMDLKSKLKAFDIGSPNKAVVRKRLLRSPCLLEIITP